MSTTASAAARQALDDNLGFRIAAAGRVLRASADTALAPLGIAAPSYGVLLRLAEDDGLSQGDLARRQSVEPPSMCRMVDRLQRDGLVRRRRDADDRRVVRVHLTDRGREVIARGSTLLDDHHRRLATALGPGQRRTLRGLLDRLTAGLA